MFVAVAIRFGLPAKDQYAYYLAWGGLVCMLVYTLGQWREIARVFGRRQARYGTLAGVSLLVVLGILIAINYIGKHQNKRWDLTVAKQFSLSDQTPQRRSAKLDCAAADLGLRAGAGFPALSGQAEGIRVRVEAVSTEYIDPDKKPDRSPSRIRCSSTARSSSTTRAAPSASPSNTEQDITNGIIKVVSGQQKKVYFTQGHGEKDPTSAERDGYNGIADALERENYTVDKVVLAQQGAVPDDAAPS